MDRLSKMVKCILIKGITAKDAARVFYIHVWKDHVLPNSIIFDRGRPFVNHFWEQLITRLGISADLSTAYHPKTDGQTEIMNFVLEQYLRTYVNYFQNDWAFWLPSTEFVMNNHVSETTQCILFLTNSKQHFKMGLEPDPFINKPMDFRERTDRDIANFFVEKMAKINEVLKKQMVFVQISYEYYANVHKQNVPNYVLDDEVWLDTRNMQTKRPNCDGLNPYCLVVSLGR